MRYSTWQRKKGDKCPFCNLTKEEIIYTTEHTNIILSRAKYHKDHILIIPKKHTEYLSRLKQIERQDLMENLNLGIKKLRKKYENMSIIYREGTCKGIGKSVPHMHFHIIPNTKIGPERNVRKRIFFREKTYIRKTKEIKTNLFN